MRKAVISAGRYNPPTGGHDTLFELMELISKSKGLEPVVFIVDGLKSGQDQDRNPLTAEERKDIIRSVHPRLRVEIVNTAAEIFDVMDVMGYEIDTWIAGSDRVTGYSRMCESMGYPEVTVTGIERIEGQGIAGFSGTMARAAARSGDWVVFDNIMPSGLTPTHSRKVYDLIRSRTKHASGVPKQRTI